MKNEKMWIAVISTVGTIVVAGINCYAVIHKCEKR